MPSEIPFVDFTYQHGPLQTEIDAVIGRVVRSNNFVLGPELFSFEKQFAAYHKISFCAGVANGSDAIYLSLAALEVKAGDEVIVPSNTYIATWLAIARTGATIVPVEPDLVTYNIDVSKMEAAITPKTKCLLPVHLFGQPCEMDLITERAKRYSIWVVEDNAQAHGAESRGRKTGSWGHINATSFYPTKNLGALGDGGAITTDDVLLFEKICRLRNYGSTDKYANEIVGINSRLDELQAAVLSVKLRHLGQWTAERRLIANTYSKLLEGVGDLILPSIVDGTTHVFHIFAIRTIHRNRLQQYLKEKGIDTLIHYPIPPHLQKAFSYLGYRKGDFPITEELADTSLSLPIWPGLTPNQIELITGSIKEFFAHHL